MNVSRGLEEQELCRDFIERDDNPSVVLVPLAGAYVRDGDV